MIAEEILDSLISGVVLVVEGCDILADGNVHPEYTKAVSHIAAMLRQALRHAEEDIAIMEREQTEARLH